MHNISTLVRRYSIVSNGFAFMTGLRMPIFFLMLVSKGFGLDEVGLLIGIMTISTFVFEIPFGSLADRYGRKTVYLLGEGCLIASYLVFWLGSDWWLFAAAMGINGIGKSLMSGSIDALFVERYRQLAKVESATADLMRDQTLVLSRSMLSMALGASAGGLIPWLLLQDVSDISVAESYSVNFALMACIATVHLLLTQWLISEPKPSATLSEPSLKPSQGAFLLQAFHTAFVTPLLLAFLTIQLSIGITFISLDTFWQPYLDKLLEGNDATWLFGLVSGASFFCMSLGQKSSMYLIKRRLPLANLLFVIQLMIGLTLASLAFVQTVWWFLMGYIGLNLLSGMMSGPLMTLFHQAVNDEQRATMLSIRSASQQLGGMTAAIAGGWLAQVYGIGMAWFIAAGFALLTTVIFATSRMREAAQYQEQSV